MVFQKLHPPPQKNAFDFKLGKCEGQRQQLQKVALMYVYLHSVATIYLNATA